MMEVVATAGHVDHGKSLLLAALTGMEPDRWEEERRRGLTIDLGYVWTELAVPDGGALTVAFVDVPGHDQFVPNMLSGVGVVEQVLLVVAADDGWSAQSEEHLAIAELLGLSCALAVVTKADLAGAGRTAEVVATVEDRLAASRLGSAPVVAADSHTGEGLPEVAATLAARLTARPRREPAGGARLWVDRVFTVAGAGTVATGMLASGRLRRGQRLAVLPGGTVGRVRGLQSLGREVEEADPGARVAVNLAGLDSQAAGRGTALVALGDDAAPEGLAATALDVELRALAHPVGQRGAWRLHLGTAATPVRVRPLLGEVAAGEVGIARLVPDRPLPARHGDRFVLRDAGRRTTVGGGVVLDPDPARPPRGAEGRLSHALVLEELAAATTDAERVAGLVDAHGGVRTRASVRRVLGRTPAPPADVADLGDHLVRGHHLEAWLTAAADAVAAAPPDQAVAAATATAAAGAAGCPRSLAAAVVERAVADGRLVDHDGRLVHHRNDVAYRQARDARERRLIARLDAEPLDPPDPERALTEVAIPAVEARALVAEGRLVAAGGLWFTAAAVAEAVRLLQQGPGRGGAPFTAAEAKRCWGTTRRAALPLLEHLRATGRTAFDGTHHRLRGADASAG